MVRIRLKKMGTKNKPFFRVVVIDSRSPRNGAAIEEIGYYNPRKPTEFSIDVEKAEYWISRGAQPTDRVLSLLKRAKKEVVPTSITPEETVGDDVKPEKGGDTDEGTD